MFLQGKPTEHSTELRATAYGQVVAQDFIPGSEVLQKTEEMTEETKDKDGKCSDVFIAH